MQQPIGTLLKSTMNDEQTHFIWSPLGEKWWRDAKEACTHKPSDLQLRFAVGRHDGLSATDAARRAGYAGDGESIRAAGSRAAKSTAVQEVLAFAFAETGTGDDGLVKGGEAKRILSRIARTGDNNARIKALESLAKIERDDRDAKDRQETSGGGDPIKTLENILVECGLCAAPIVAEMMYGVRGCVTAAPHFKIFAPFIRRRFPELWAKYRSPVADRADCFKSEAELRYLADFDAAGEGPELTDMEFRAAIGGGHAERGNGAAKQFDETVDAT